MASYHDVCSLAYKYCLVHIWKRDLFPEQRLLWNIWKSWLFAWIDLCDVDHGPCWLHYDVQVLLCIDGPRLPHTLDYHHLSPLEQPRYPGLTQETQEEQGQDVRLIRRGQQQAMLDLFWRLLGKRRNSDPAMRHTPHVPSDLHLWMAQTEGHLSSLQNAGHTRILRSSAYRP